MAGVWEAGLRGAWSLLLLALGEGGVVVGEPGVGGEGRAGLFSSLFFFPAGLRKSDQHLSGLPRP